ncbi:MAG TPA: hypothetical protein PKY56_10605 [Candidatus Kapabacteria bacterium]|nr:hypothetical protein [Candidatus Kapabacteria bacterium]
MKRIGELITGIFDNDCLFVSVCEKICINFRRNKNQQIHTNPTQKKNKQQSADCYRLTAIKNQ